MVTADCVAAYRKHKNLKLAAAEIKMPWQTLYVHLRSVGEPVIGDKSRYGSAKDKLAAMAERAFSDAVPIAVDQNGIKWQSKYDFDVIGIKVDVKAARPKRQSFRTEKKRWAFSFKKQSLICDFVCCFCYLDDLTIAKVLVVPSEIFGGIQTVSVSCEGESKWFDYSMNIEEISVFLRMVAESQSQTC